MIKKILLKTFLIIISLLILISIFPYLVPVTKASPNRDDSFQESFFKEVEGITLHYRIWEPVDTNYKGKVLLVHGLGGSTFSWRNNVDALTNAGYLVMAIDLPGFGLSSRKSGIDHSQENRSKLLWQLVDQVEQSFNSTKKPDPWNLVGHSMGGGTISAMALENPARTRSIIYVDAAVFSNGGSLGILKNYPPTGRWIEVLGRHYFLTKDKITNFLASAYGSVPTESDVDGYLKPLLLDGTEGAFVDMMRTSTTISESRLAEIKTPVFAIWGEKDSWVGISDAYKLQTIFKDMDLKIISGASHCAMETHSGLFNQYLLEALDQ